MQKARVLQYCSQLNTSVVRVTISPTSQTLTPLCQHFTQHQSEALTLAECTEATDLHFTLKGSAFALKTTPFRLITKHISEPQCPLLCAQDVVDHMPLLFDSCSQKGAGGHRDELRSPNPPAASSDGSDGLTSEQEQKLSVNKPFKIHYYGVNIVSPGR